jgi:hypothetical protein
MNASMKLFPSTSFSDDEDFDFDCLEAAPSSKDAESVETACSVAEVAKATLVLNRLDDPSGETSKKTAGFHKSINPEKLRAVARTLFN